VRTLIFGGPSLHGMDLSDVAGLERHGPIKHGDLFRAALAPGDTVLVVDGVYQHYAPIRYKEIIAMLRRGVRVLGAASMGALRAAELAPLGMEGVGQVYRWYAEGELEADGDVALTHGHAEVDYRPLSLTVVSLLYAARQLRRLPEARVQRLVENARTVPFSVRSERALLGSTPPGSELRADTEAVCARLAASPEHDVKRQDVRALLARARADADGDYPARLDTADALRTLPVTAWERQWAMEETPLPEGACTAGELLRYCQLFLPDWPRRHRAWARERIGTSAPGRPFAEIVRDHTAPGASAEEQLTEAVRTFRAGPGKFVHGSFPWTALRPEELPGLCRLTALALAGTRLAEQRHASFSHGQVARREVIEVFAELWEEPWADRCFLDRGFTTEEEFLRAARPYFVAARATVRGRAGAGAA
jgi:hypothetical protein